MIQIHEYVIIFLLIMAPISSAQNSYALDSANQNPVAVDDVYVSFVDSTLHAHVAIGLLANDYDPDGDTISAILEDAPLQGFVSVNSDGSFTYTSKPGFSGEDRFTYAITDGKEFDLGVAMISVVTQSPIVYVEQVIADLKQMIVDGEIDKKTAATLIKKLQSAVTQLENDKVESAIGMLNAAINEINAAINSKKIDPVVGKELIAEIQEIIDYLKGI